MSVRNNLLQLELPDLLRFCSNYILSGSNRSTNEICRAIAAYWKDGDSLETGSEYSALLFPFGNQRAVHRHINEAHVDAADRAIAKKWVKKQPAANQSQIRELLGLNDEGEEDEGTSDPESDADVPPARSRKRKASKAAPGKSKQVSWKDRYPCLFS